MSSRQDLQQRALVAKLSREDLEDQHLRTLEDINILKAHARKQEEKIKKWFLLKFMLYICSWVSIFWSISSAIWKI